MASADAIAFNPMTTAGLGGPLDRADLNVSRLKYNELPYVKELKYLNTTHRDHLVALLKIIDANSMGQWFGIHSAHRHERLPDGTIRFEEDTGIDKLSLTKAAPVEGVDLSNMHATAFKLIENEFVAVEFANGPSPADGSKIPPTFLAEIANHLAENNLARELALEVKDYAKRDAEGQGPTAEIEVQWGNTLPFTVVVPVSVLADATHLVPTGWNVNPTAPARDGDPPAGEHWNEVVSGPKKGSHTVHVDSVDPVTPEGVFKQLVEQGIIIGAMA